ncbi:MAG TPA: hypothetical protein VF183_05570 [Acidimicrobiales bacterium]
MNNPKKLILALTGRRGAGKTTVARWFGGSYKCRVIHGAALIHAVTAGLFKLDHALFDGAAKDRDLVDDGYTVASGYGATPRDLMLHTSRVLRHHFGDGIWIAHSVATIEASSDGLYIVDNFRGQLELDALKSIPDAEVVSIRLICVDDPMAVQDEMDARVEETSCDIVVEAPRLTGDIADRSPVMLCLAVLDQLVALLGHREDLVEFFQPLREQPEEPDAA